ncbi:hypothetical protein HQ865_01300 [Mucilaginibacter mali]|uniref:XRE family transcriptional regulator n=1 Tax=Mucilaginibacter mali TaxID=2740462 RepID=A0A7D4Q5C3_9SPHI|nr:hypothetical protein [Mucilaginibacter mali]QKJ28451.1 hypothetical protein HQ865_01300 [Mucilaginibacter mali]
MCANPKYNIGRLISAMPGNPKSNRYKFCIELHIDIRTLDNWDAVPAGSKHSISADHLLKAASFLNCQPTELING